MLGSLGLLVCLIPSPADTDLAAKYKPALDHVDGAGGQSWMTTPDDVWALSSFRYACGDDLLIDLGPSQLVLGRQGTSVVWGALLPAQPGKLVRAPQGAGEQITSVFLRFHPSLVGKLFPPKTVQGSGDPLQLVWARRLYQHKIDAAWQWDNLPVVPTRESLVFDCETTAKNRRFFMVDAEKSRVKYEPAFLGRRVPDATASEIKPGDGAKLFDEAWSAFDKEYAMFALKKGVDWDRLRDTYRPLAVQARTSYEAAGVINLLVAHLEDLHVWVRCGEESLWPFVRFRPQNGSWRATQKAIGEITDAGDEISWGRTQDGIGYVCVFGLEKPGQPDTFDRVLEPLKTTKGLILDLRFNGGGSEDLGLAMAGRFLDKERVYSVDQYRNGPKREQLGNKIPRKVGPRGSWHYTSPVAVLIGQKTMSSAESFALMMAQCPQVTTMGDHTAGSSANPRRLELAGGIAVNLPRWLDMDPSSKPIDLVGVAPAVPVKASAKDFTDTHDPVIEAALDLLRKGKPAKKPR